MFSPFVYAADSRRSVSLSSSSFSRFDNRQPARQSALNRQQTDSGGAIRALPLLISRRQHSDDRAQAKTKRGAAIGIDQMRHSRDKDAEQ